MVSGDVEQQWILPEIVLEFVPDCRPCKTLIINIALATFFWQKEFETDKFHKRNGVVGKEPKCWGCQQGIEDQQLATEKQMEDSV